MPNDILTERSAYRHWTKDILRYGDTDRQGHVNNAVFSTFLESGRVAILYNKQRPVTPRGCAFVIARLVLDFRAEILWPGEVETGSALSHIGNSSVRFGQGIFTATGCAATAETTIVLMDEQTRKSRPLPDEARAALVAIMGGAA
jgi:acyl-CoA thioester hydrolase